MLYCLFLLSKCSGERILLVCFFSLSNIMCYNAVIICICICICVVNKITEVLLYFFLYLNLVLFIVLDFTLELQMKVRGTEKYLKHRLIISLVFKSRWKLFILLTCCALLATEYILTAKAERDQ